MPARPYTTNTTPDHLGGGTTTRRPPVTRMSPEERARLEQARIPLDDPRINDVGSQGGLSFNQISNAMMSGANSPTARPPAPPPGPGPGPGGGGYGRGGGGGGGGGGGAMSREELQKLYSGYAQKMLELGGGMFAREDTLSPFINKAVDADVAQVGKAFGAVGPMEGNAYRESPQFQATQFDPQISAMMASQGFGGEFGDAARMAGQYGLDSNAGMWNNLNTAMGNNTAQSNNAWNQNLKADQGYATANIEAQRAAMLAAAQTRHQAERDSWRDKRQQMIMDLLASGYESGSDVSGIDFSGLRAPRGGSGFVA